jgi:hypothetical protein
MKTYIEAIEKILGTELDRDVAVKYEFSQAVLNELKAFASGYSKEKAILPGHDQQINCYFPLPEILSGDFRTYNSNGSLKGHWPTADELANMVMVTDHFIIHDHLEHYAGSAISGYTEGHRYDGLRNWLTALADWKPLIIKDIICILPQDLVCSGPFQKLQDEGDIQGIAAGIYYEIYPESGNFSNGYEAEELMSGLTEMEDYLTTLSIVVNRDGKFAPYYNYTNGLELHESIADAALKLFRLKAFTSGDDKILSEEIIESGNIARLVLDAFIFPSDITIAEICNLRLKDDVLASLREDIRMSIRKFSGNPAFLRSPGLEFQDHLASLQASYKRQLAKYTSSSARGKHPSKKITVGFAGMVSSKSLQKNFTGPMMSLRTLVNNLPVKAQLPESICHYYLSFTDEK